MRVSRSKTAVAVALVSAFAMAATASANAASTTCKNNGTIKVSPGFEAKAKVQNITIRGTLSECKGEGSTVTGGGYMVHAKTAEAVSCAALSSTGAAMRATSIDIGWTPGEEESEGSFAMPLTEMPVALSGEVESGLFAGDTISGAVTQKYTGGPECSGSPGKGKGKGKKPKKVKDGTFSGTLAIS